jgi:hypothetical protein
MRSRPCPKKIAWERLIARAKYVAGLQIKTLKIGPRGVCKDLQSCCQFYNARKMGKYRPKCNKTNHNIMTNLSLNVNFCLITIIFKINLLQLLNGFTTA